MSQWLQCGVLPMSLPVVRFRIPLGARFHERYIMFLPSQYWDIVSMLCPWASHLAYLAAANFYVWPSAGAKVGLNHCYRLLGMNFHHYLLTIHLRFDAIKSSLWRNQVYYTCEFIHSYTAAWVRCSAEGTSWTTL